MVHNTGYRDIPLALARIVNRTINVRFGDSDTLHEVTNPRRRSFGRMRAAAHSLYQTIHRPSYIVASASSLFKCSIYW